MAASSASRYCLFLAGLVLILLSLSSLTSLANEAESDESVFSSGATQQQLHVAPAKPTRYLLYDINPGEGFNLRRDVYMRIANLVKALNEVEPWILVLPPWGRLYHWKSRGLNQLKIPWSTFFEVLSLSYHIPVIEYEDYIKVTGEPQIDLVYYLQNYAEGWTDGKWEEKIDERDCIDNQLYKKNSDGKYRGWFWGYSETYANEFKCLSVQAMAGQMLPILTKNISVRSVMLDRADELLHDRYGQVDYWRARRSLRFAKHLRDIGDEFRRINLDSNDEKDKTEVIDDWREMRKEPSSAIGGPYIAAHLRRQDYARNNRKDVPSLQNAAEHLKKLLKEHKLKKLFISTDAPKFEIKELKDHLTGYEVYNYVPPKAVLENFMDGGVAIIDQWISAHARYFIGTGTSTFSFRIHEERQILGFDPKMTYNRFCGDGESDSCDQPTVWNIQW
ncbi:putative GDP-fucose protein O-fucosyltransferase 2-like [Apostichopus japonicus]|uniref:GDP-fucose protein O-fucosyltransferase 2 n=1 Tax=Stichopus japonicus TaxID=307972 RepID=A0A2G8JNH8_STIJA|nr:putative GDP-fucose protein O-fucosyltransferase 2-like [Apostichopus japonicus]